MEALFNLDGNIATLTVYEDHCVITGKKNLFGFMGGRAFDGSKEFYYSDMTSVQYKKASAFINGFIQFEYPGSQGGGNYGSENSFVIMKGKTDLAQCEKAYEYIKERISFYKQNKGATVVAALSPAEELKKFKELLDSGIISQEEFDLKKKNLLGL